MSDPKSKYDSPPQPTQQQEPPGHTAEMSPRPDHGEESYKGSGKLSGKVALITAVIPASAAPLRSPSREKVPMSSCPT
jgi:hypothetical protein